MTTELEEQFFKTFGIEKIECCKHFKYFDSKCDRLDSTEKCLDCIGTNKVYPEITDRKLLEMICILNDFEGINVKGTTIKELKEELLKQCIEPFEYPIAFEEHHEIDKLYHQIQQLFKEGE